MSSSSQSVPSSPSLTLVSSSLSRTTAWQARLQPGSGWVLALPDLALRFYVCRAPATTREGPQRLLLFARLKVVWVSLSWHVEQAGNVDDEAGRGVSSLSEYEKSDISAASLSEPSGLTAQPLAVSLAGITGMEMDCMTISFYN
jgi:hypothetical protein